jgi:hypothetical protein
VNALTWQDLNFRDEVVLPDGSSAQVVGVRECAYHPSGDAQLQLPDMDADEDPLWYAVEDLVRTDGPTADDIEAALDAKAEDDRIEAERGR